MRARAGLLVLVVGLASLRLAGAQTPQSNPVAAASVRIGALGLATGPVPATSPTQFKPNGRHDFIGTYAKALFEADEQRKGFEAFAAQLIESYEKSAKEMGLSYDASAALAFSVSLLYSVARSEELADAAFLALVHRLQATFDSAEVRGAGDARKQEAYEWALCSAGLVLSVATAAKTEAEQTKVRDLAAVQLEALLGAKLDQIALKGDELVIRPIGAPSAGPSGLAPGFAFQAPPNWVEDGAWHVLSTQDGDRVTAAMVRFPPAIPAGGNMGDALRAVWKANVPAPLADAAGGMVYRRYVGAKLFSQFIFGKGREEGRRSDSVFTLFLVDCGSMWQPVVVAQTYREQTPNAAVEGFSAKYSYPVSADDAEAMLATFRCPSAPNQALAAGDALVGSYRFGSANSLQWENIYTGATSMTFTSSGGTLDLAPDGTFTYTFTSANGQVGATVVRGVKAAGTYSIQGDILTCTYTSYDQGDATKRKEAQYRLAGLTQFPGGEKVMVLFDDLKVPVNNVTVAQSGTWYSTKKAGGLPPR